MTLHSVSTDMRRSPPVASDMTCPSVTSVDNSAPAHDHFRITSMAEVHCFSMCTHHPTNIHEQNTLSQTCFNRNVMYVKLLLRPQLNSASMSAWSRNKYIIVEHQSPPLRLTLHDILQSRAAESL